MDIDRFWAVIEEARTIAGPAADHAVRDLAEVDDDPGPDGLAHAVTAVPDGANSQDDGAEVTGGEDDGDSEVYDDYPLDPVAAALVSVLVRLPTEEIAVFDQIFQRVRLMADRDDLANAAILIEHGFLGDDSFEDFRAGLVALGRAAFDRAIADPDSLADHSLVREIAEAGDPRWLGREDMIFAASLAYEQLTDDIDGFFEFGERVLAAVGNQDLGVPGPSASDEDWTVTDEAETRRHLPRLSDLFYERAMRNRQWVVDSLGLTN